MHVIRRNLSRASSVEHDRCATWIDIEFVPSMLQSSEGRALSQEIYVMNPNAPFTADALPSRLATSDATRHVSPFEIVER